MTEYKLVVIGSAGVGKGLSNKKKYTNNVRIISFSNGPSFIFYKSTFLLFLLSKKERPHYTTPTTSFHFRVRAHHRGRLQGTGISELYTYIELYLYRLL